MRATTHRWLAIGSMAVAIGLLPACGGTDSAAPAAPTTAAPTTPEPTTPAPVTATSARATAPATGGSPAAEAPGGTSVECGPIDAPNGQVGLTAVATEAGTVGCTEAINVITEYFDEAPTRSEGTARALTVSGWSCLADTGAQGSGTIGCDKDGLAFHTVPAR